MPAINVFAFLFISESPFVMSCIYFVLLWLKSILYF